MAGEFAFHSDVIIFRINVEMSDFPPECGAEGTGAVDGVFGREHGEDVVAAGVDEAAVEGFDDAMHGVEGEIAEGFSELEMPRWGDGAGGFEEVRGVGLVEGLGFG